MSQQPAEKTIEYNVVIKGPNGEKVEVTVTPSDTAASMRERVIAFYSLSAYSNFHFEVDAKPSRIRLDEVTSSTRALPARPSIMAAATSQLAMIAYCGDVDVCIMNASLKLERSSFSVSES